VLTFNRKGTRVADVLLPPETSAQGATVASAWHAVRSRFARLVAAFATMLNDPAQGFQAALERHRPRIVVDPASTHLHMRVSECHPCW